MRDADIQLETENFLSKRSLLFSKPKQLFSLDSLIWLKNFLTDKRKFKKIYKWSYAILHVNATRYFSYFLLVEKFDDFISQATEVLFIEVKR